MLRVPNLPFPSLTVNENFTSSLSWLPDLKGWIKSMAELGIYQEINARLYITALNKISSIVFPDENLTLQSFLENLEDLGNRYAIKCNANPSTVRSYLSRARTVLEGYVSYQSAPSKFKAKAPRIRLKEKENDSIDILPKELSISSNQLPPSTEKFVPSNALFSKPEDRRANFKDLTNQFLQVFPLCEEPLSVEELTTFLLQLLPKCEGGLSPEQFKKLFLHLLPYCAEIDAALYAEFLSKISKHSLTTNR